MCVYMCYGFVMYKCKFRNLYIYEHKYYVYHMYIDFNVCVYYTAPPSHSGSLHYYIEEGAGDYYSDIAQKG